MKASIVRNFFQPDVFIKLKEHVETIATRMKGEPLQDLVFNRHHVNNEPAIVKLHEMLVPWLSEYLSTPVKKSYSFLSIYRDGGICPRHTDRPQCKYTVDLCVSQKETWPIYIDDVPYRLLENDAVIYSGTDSPHYRQRLQDGNYCNLIFFHFVDEDFVGSLD